MKFSYITKSAHGTKSAFTLIEVTLALGIASFCLLTVFALLPIGITTNQNASEQTTASGIATAISADLRGNLVVGGTTSRFGLQIPNASASASPSAGASPGANTNASPSAQTLFFSQDGNISEKGTPASGTTAVAAGFSPSRYRAMVTMAAVGPSKTPLAKVFSARIFITWPALADGDSHTPASHFAGSYETFTTLDCN